MKRREVLKALGTLLLTPLLGFTIDSQLYTFGGWFLTDTPGRYEFQVMTGTADDRDAFFNGLTGFSGRGWYVFVLPDKLDQDSVDAFRSLFESGVTQYLPVIMK